MKILRAELEDLKKILQIQKAAFFLEADFYGMYDIRPLKMTLSDIKSDYKFNFYLKAVLNNEIVGSVKYRIEKTTGYIGNLVINPVYHNQGFGSRLLAEALNLLNGTERIELFTGKLSKKNIHLYEKFKFRIFDEKYLSENEPKMVFMERINAVI